MIVGVIVAVGVTVGVNVIVGVTVGVDVGATNVDRMIYVIIGWVSTAVPLLLLSILIQYNDTPFTVVCVQSPGITQYTFPIVVVSKDDRPTTVSPRDGTEVHIDPFQYAHVAPDPKDPTIPTLTSAVLNGEVYPTYKVPRHETAVGETVTVGVIVAVIVGVMVVVGVTVVVIVGVTVGVIVVVGVTVGVIVVVAVTVTVDV